MGNKIKDGKAQSAMIVFLASNYSGLNQAVVVRREWSEHTLEHGEPWVSSIV